MAQIVDEISRVEPLPLSRRVAALPGVAVRILLGSKKLFYGGDQVRLALGPDAVVLHEEDFRIASRVASRVATALPTRQVSPATVISAMELANKYVIDELFAKDALRVLYFSVPKEIAEASAFYRCVIPSLALQASGNVVPYVTKERSVRQAMDFDVVVMQLGYSEADRRLAETLQEAGKKVVFEVDDAFDALEEWHPSYEHFRKDGTQDAVKRMLSQADLVTVTTPYLAERYRPYAKAVEVIPNCITLHDWPKAEPRNGGPFRVVWAGSPSHFGDLAEVGSALSEFAGRHADVRLVFFGRRPVGLKCPETQVEFHDWVGFGDFPSKLADLAGDVSIAPLADVPFNRAKSNLRLIQYGATGYPIIASAVGEYQRTGLGKVSLCRTTDDWLSALELHRSNLEFRKFMKLRSEELADEYDIGRHAPAIEKVYRKLAALEGL